MKKGILMLSAALFAGVSFSQTIFSESFDTSIPATWTIIDVDGLTSTSGQSAFASWAWNSTVQDASSSSWYNNSGLGPTDDWLITPAIAIPASGNIVLQFDGASHEANYLEEYEVMVSVGGATVPEFTTQILNVVNEPLAGAVHTLSLSAYLGQTIHIAFHHTSNDESMLHIDNVQVKSIAANDAELTGLTLPKYVMQNSSNPVGIDVKNVGASPITSVLINLSVDGVDFQQLFNTNIAPGATTTLTHGSPIIMWDIKQNLVDVTIQQVNNSADADQSNNSASTSITSVGYAAPKTVLIEEGTGTWCGWCPRGAVAMEYMYNTYTTGFLGVAVHNNDPMTVAAYNSGADLSGYPGCNVDRVMLDQGVSSAAFESYYNARKDLIVPAQVGLTETVVGSDISIVASAVFHSNFSSADFRLGVIMIENDVTGTSSGYNQTNYYAGGANGAMGGYEALPDPVPAAQMVYDHVGRALLGGYGGQVGSVPTTLVNGQVVNYTFNYTVPATSDIANMHAIAVLIDNNTGEIVNAGNSAVDPSASIAPISSVKNLSIFPNPASDKFNVEFDADGGDYVVTLTDLTGKVVSTNNLSSVSGTSTVAIDVANLKAGNYLVAVANGSASYTKMVTVK